MPHTTDLKLLRNYVVPRRVQSLALALALLMVIALLPILLHVTPRVAVAVENPRPGQATAAAGGAGTPPQALPIVVDETSAQRCRVLMARNSGESFKPLASTVSSRPDPERTGHYFVSLISRQADGSRKNHGGSIFMGSMYRFVDSRGSGLAANEKFEVFTGSVDECDGSYTFHFDLQFVPGGMYSFAVAILGQDYLHEAAPLSPPQCGAQVASTYLPPDVYSRLGRFETGKMYFPGLKISRPLPRALVTRTLPPCTMGHGAQGRWVDPSICMGGEYPCRPGPAYMLIPDRYLWVPYACQLAYVPPESLGRYLAGTGVQRVALLGDSRSYNIFLSFSDYMRGVLPNPDTGLVSPSELARSDSGIQYENRGFYHGQPLDHMHFEAHNISFHLVESYGTLPRFSSFPCNTSESEGLVNQGAYISLRNGIGTFFEKIEALSKVSPLPELIIFQDGGLQDMFASVSDTYYEESLIDIAAAMRKNFKNSRMIYMTMPAVHALGQYHYSIRSYSRQARRTRLSTLFFRGQGFEVWDTFPMTVSRSDRYYSSEHFYPQSWKAKDFPKLLSDELIQDLVNRMII